MEILRQWNRFWTKKPSKFVEYELTGQNCVARTFTSSVKDMTQKNRWIWDMDITLKTDGHCRNKIYWKKHKIDERNEFLRMRFYNNKFGNFSFTLVQVTTLYLLIILKINSLWFHTFESVCPKLFPFLRIFRVGFINKHKKKCYRANFSDCH